MKKQNMNNLLVNGKKLALMVMLATSVGACGNTKENTELKNIQQDSTAQSDKERQKDKKTLLWFVPLILLGAVGGIGFTGDAKSKHR